MQSLGEHEIAVVSTKSVRKAVRGFTLDTTRLTKYRFQRLPDTVASIESDRIAGLRELRFPPEAALYDAVHACRLSVSSLPMEDQDEYVRSIAQYHGTPKRTRLRLATSCALAPTTSS